MNALFGRGRELRQGAWTRCLSRAVFFGGLPTHALLVSRRWEYTHFS